jgi:hypothetical protein
MNRLTKYNKNKLSRVHKLIFSIILLVLTIGLGYSALVTNLSISGNLLVKKYENPNLLFNKIVSLSATDTCIVKYEGDVTDEVDNTIEATQVYFDRCVDRRNVKFGGYCWQIIRTTETGGTKLIYNGSPTIVDGKKKRRSAGIRPKYTI